LKRLCLIGLWLPFLLAAPAEGAQTAAPSPVVSAKIAVAAAPRLHVDGKHFKDPGGRVVVLRGVSLIELHDVTLKRPGPEFMIDLVTDPARGWHARVVRLPVFPGYYLPDPQGYVKEFLEPAVDYCTAKGLYCIIDWHYGESPFVRDEETRRFWADVAPRFKDYPNVFYEIFNEPVTPKPADDKIWRAWRSQAQQWVDQIRAVAPDNILLIGGPHFSQQIAGAVDYPLEGRNLAYVGHVYPGGSYPNFLGWNRGNKGWEENIGVVADKYPVFVTEWGFGYVHATKVNGTVEDFGAPFRKWAEKKGVSWTAWIADYDWYPSMFERNWQPTRFGAFVQAWLASKKAEPIGGR